MTAQTKLEAVLSPAQLLREAIARRDAIAKESAAIEQKLHFINPIQAEEATAQAELRAVMQRDADAMQTWMNDGAPGAAPEPDRKAREAAANKLAQINAKLTAAGRVKAQLEAEHAAAHSRYLQADEAVRAAEGQVMGDEYIRSAQALKDAYLAQIRAEHHYDAAKDAMFATSTPMASALSERTGEILRPLNLEGGRVLAAEVYQRAKRRFAALRAGEEPEVTA